MKPELDFAGRQIRGTRKTQDDSYSFCPLSSSADGFDGLLLVLADGMGGYEGGSLASSLVVEAFIEHFCHARGSIPSRLFGSMRASERRLHEEIARGDESLSKMGSTLLGIVWTPNQLHWVSVGDSGLYLYQGKTVRRLNADHSMAPLLEAKADRGEISRQTAANHPDRGALRSAVAIGPLELYELRDIPFRLEEGDVVIAATDGLNSIGSETFNETVESNYNQTAEQMTCDLLKRVDKAEKKHQDNTTVAVIRNSVTPELES
jgi:protein phosphatase